MFLTKLIHYTRYLLPANCILCGNITYSVHNLCSLCTKNLPILSQNCQQCARLLHINDMGLLSICGVCLKKPPPFTLTHALFPYHWPIPHFIIALKFHGKLCYAKTLGELMAEKISTDWYKQNPLPDLILPVPLHRARLAERGFNQALEIAKPIAKKLNIPIARFATERTKYTEPQSGLSAIERKRNIAKAFCIKGDYSNLSIAVIDDVITTGHTITEFCKTLKQHGAANIHVWCCARR